MLTISDSTVAGNGVVGVCFDPGLPICGQMFLGGGGILNGGTMVISNSTLASNYTALARGGQNG